jgi:signal transduction histidine kinase
MTAIESKPVSAPASGTPAPGEFAEFMRMFHEATGRLQETHAALSAQVERLQAELAEANERLRRSRSLAALGEMAAGIAHEIRNPLGAIALNAELLKEDVADRPDAAASVDKIRRAAERLDRIVGDVLSFARDTRVHAVETDAQEGVAHEVAFEGDCAFVADGALLAQAVSNLVRNAVEAMQGSPVRSLRLSAARARLRTPDGRRREHVVLAVEDTGPGIPAAARERIFNPFFTTREEGTGLGLAIVHRIVDAHGGTTVCSDARFAAPGQGPGARIELALPLEPARVAAAEGVSLGEAVRRRIGGSAAQVHAHTG